MDKAIALVSALAWPIASVIIAVISLIIIWRLTGATGKLKMGIKDWFNVERESHSPSAVSQSQDVLESPIPTIERNTQIVEEATMEELSTSVNPDVGSPKFVTESDATNIDELFIEFKEKSPRYKESSELWETLYIVKRGDYGLADDERELQALADANVSWVWPLVILIKRYVQLHNLPSAEAALAQALSRGASDKRKWVLKQGVNLYFTFFGFERAFSFVHDQIALGVLNTEISAMFDTLASYGDNEDPFSRAILDEISIRMQRDDNLKFNIAHNYANIREFGVIGFDHYRDLTNDDDDDNQSNNMGCLLEDGSSVQIDYFEQEVRRGAPIAIANVARSLARNGFVARAERLLESAPSEELGSEGYSALADARAKVAKARDQVQESKKKIEGFAKEQYKRYAAMIFAGYEFFKKSGPRGPVGAFISDDRKLVIVIGEPTRCAYRSDERTFGGELTRKPLCFEGQISGSGGGGILDMKFHRVLAVQVTDDKVRALLWPTGFSLDKPLEIIELTRLHDATMSLGDEQDASRLLLA
jgi:hypothetical protein